MIMINSTIILMSFPNISHIFRHMLPHAHDLPVNDGTILPAWHPSLVSPSQADGALMMFDGALMGISWLYFMIRSYP